MVLTFSHAPTFENCGRDESGLSTDDDVAGNGSAESWRLLFARRIRCRVQWNVNDMPAVKMGTGRPHAPTRSFWNSTTRRFD